MSHKVSSTTSLPETFPRPFVKGDIVAYSDRATGYASYYEVFEVRLPKLMIGTQTTTPFEVDVADLKPIGHINERLDSPNRANALGNRIWRPVHLVMSVVNKALSGDWTWVWNTRCKYIELRIDMRDGHCLIRDKDGHLITLEQLEYQYVREQPSR